MEAFTPRNVVKFVVTSTIQFKSHQFAKDAITDHTQFEKDDLVTKLGAGMASWYVTSTLKPHTDKLVDKTADKINEARANRAAKKTAEETK